MARVEVFHQQNTKKQTNSRDPVIPTQTFYQTKVNVWTARRTYKPECFFTPNSISSCRLERRINLNLGRFSARSCISAFPQLGSFGVVDIAPRPDRSQLSLPFSIEDLYAGINYFVFCLRHHQSAARSVSLSVAYSPGEDVPLLSSNCKPRPCEYCTRDDDYY